MPSREVDIGALSTAAGTFASWIWPDRQLVERDRGHVADAVGGLAGGAELQAVESMPARAASAGLSRTPLAPVSIAKRTGAPFTWPIT